MFFFDEFNYSILVGVKCRYIYHTLRIWDIYIYNPVIWVLVG